MTDLVATSVFLSGPMTGLPNYNVDSFAKVHAALREMGVNEIYDPAIEYLTEDPRYPVGSHEGYMRICLRELTEGRWSERDRRMRPKWEVLISLPGWEDSAGARLERDVAAAIGMECVEWEW